VDYLEDSKAAGRHLMPDLVRVIALIGIAVVNVGLIAYPMTSGYLDGGFQSGADEAAFWGVNTLFTFKSYTLFSFMFGVGFAYQMQSAQKHRAQFGSRYARRIIGLLVLGIFHIAFLFQGDILAIYGVLGALLYLFRNTKVKTLLRWGASLLVLQIFILLAMAGMMKLGQVYAAEEMAQEIQTMQLSVGHANAVFGNGTFAQSIILRLSEYGQTIGWLILIQGPGIFAFLLFGLAAVRSDIIANPSAQLWSKFRRIALPIGLIGSILGATLVLAGDNMMDPKMMLGMAIIAAASPFSTAGYLGLIAKWVGRPMSGFTNFMARGGTATLSAYLLQSLILSLVFNNYGLGFFGQLGAAACTAIAFGAALFTIVFASLWRTKFKHGPFEAILRSWTYLGTR